MAKLQVVAKIGNLILLERRSKMDFIVKLLLQRALPMVLPMALGWLAEQAAAFLLQGKICPATNVTLFCQQVWPQLVGLITAAITYVRTHPNGLNGPAAPDAASVALSKVNLAPQPPPSQPSDSVGSGGNG